MKCFYLFILVILSGACKAKSSGHYATTNEPTKTSCPDNSFCTLERFENKSLLVKTDDLGAVYLELSEGKNLVLKFEYEKSTNKKLMDGSYREEVFVELNPDDLDFETTDLTNRKLFFARWCYCKGATGYYKITEGQLRVSRLNDTEAYINLKFKINEVPQIINEVNETFSFQ